MKKILTLIGFAVCLGFAAQAQTSTSGGQIIDNATVKTVVAEPIADDAAVNTGTNSKADCKPSKSCCSSKESKETAAAGSKACCSDSKKSKSHCSDKDKKAALPSEIENKSDTKTKQD